MARFVKLLVTEFHAVPGRQERSMSTKTAHLLTSALVSAAMVGTPLAAEAGGMSHMGSHGGHVPRVPPVSTCGPVGRPPSVTNNYNVYKRTSIENNIKVYKPVTVNKNLNVTTNIDNSKTINVTKTIDNSKTVDNSKTISINKSIVINKGGDNVSVSAETSAQAFASANAASLAGAVAIGGGGWAPEAPGAYAGGDIGTLQVETRAQCTVQEATIVKSIHAVCVSAEGHEFPASHMLADSWIASGYEGEVVRCIPGSHLKISIGKVVQSDQGLAAGITGGESLTCGAHEALRHYKNGQLKCAAAVPVVDCTERTNLRKYGTADLFFSYRAEVCLETQQDYSQVSSAGIVRRP